MRILLTGSSGFIGSRLIKMFAHNHYEIVALNRRPIAMPGIQEVIVPALQLDLIESALKHDSIDAIIHLAAAGVSPSDREAKSLVKINTILPGQLVELAQRKGVKAVVIAGSSAEYKDCGKQLRITEDAPVEMNKTYGATKAAGTMLALVQGLTLGVAVCVLRLFNIFGPGEAPHRLFPSLFCHLKAGSKVPLSIGNQIRDFVYVDDACMGFMCALEALVNKEMASGIYNLATGVGHSVMQFAQFTAQALDAPEHLLNFGALEIRPDEIPYLIGDPSAFTKACGWQTSLSLKQNLVKAVAEMKLENFQHHSCK